MQPISKKLLKLKYFQQLLNAENAIWNPFLPQTAPLGTCSAGPVSWNTFCLILVQKSSRNGRHMEPRDRPRRAQKGTRIEAPKCVEKTTKMHPKKAPKIAHRPPPRNRRDGRGPPETVRGPSLGRMLAQAAPPGARGAPRGPFLELPGQIPSLYGAQGSVPGLKN